MRNLFDKEDIATLTSKLFQYVAYGRKSEIEKLLSRNPELLEVRGNMIDKSDRIFKNITVFEYILWALDVKYMAPMMLKCLPKNQEGEKIRLNLLAQFHRVKTEKVSYELNGKLYTESHYDFSLIDVLSNFIEQFERRTWDERNQAWCEGVGMSQRLVPVHVAENYCNFDESCKINNWIDGQESTWFSPELGHQYAILRGDSPQAGCINGLRNGGVLRFGDSWEAWEDTNPVQVDLKELINVRDARVGEDLDNLFQQLNTPLYNLELDDENRFII